MTNQELADTVGLSPSPCLRRLRTLEAEGVIRGYAADVDPAAYGLGVTGFVHVELREQNERTVRVFEDAIRHLDYVT